MATAPFQDRIDSLAKQLHVTDVQLAHARRRYDAERTRAQTAHKEWKRLERRADKRRGEGHVRRARELDDQARRQRAVASNSHNRAEHYLAKIKERTQLRDGLDVRYDKILENLEKWKRNNAAHFVSDNKIAGGSDWDKWMLATQTSVANCAGGKRRNFYSMPGTWDIKHVITPGEDWGERSDCSSTVTGWAWTCGFDDPNGEDFLAGYTGTLQRAAGRWREVSLATMLAGYGKYPAYIVYGSADGHHTEAWCPTATDRMRSAGHGSAPVDYGTTHLFGSGEVERYFQYVS